MIENISKEINCESTQRESRIIPNRTDVVCWENLLLTFIEKCKKKNKKIAREMTQVIPLEFSGKIRENILNKLRKNLENIR